MRFLDDFAETVARQEPLAPYTYLRLGGPALALARPRSVEELTALISRCLAEKVPYRILGGGANVLVPDEGVAAVVIRLSAPAFTAIEVKARTVSAGAGASLSALISSAAQHALGGLEFLIGIPGTVGGGLRSNAGARGGSISQFLSRIETYDAVQGIQVRDRDEIAAAQTFPLDDALILKAEFALEPDSPEAILKRMRKFWIHKKAHQPLSFQAAARLFRDPKGQTADLLIEQAGLQGSRVGGAELSERHPNFVVAHPGATARDVLRLIDMVRTRVADRFGLQLPLDLVVW